MITETGYHRRTYEEILADLTLKAQELFGEDIDVSNQTFLGKALNLIAYMSGKHEENDELIYYARFTNTASGLSLDRLGPFVGTSRNVATPARYEVTVTGEAGATIPLGFLVSTESGLEFYNIAEATIAAGETTCTITVECTTAGTMGNVVPSDITEIVNPEAGIDSVIGSKTIAVGKDEESDYELRERMNEAGEGAGSCNEASIRASLLRVPTVTSATVIVNDTDETDIMGNVPHSIACYVAGGADYGTEIGEAIFRTKPAGIKTNGTIQVEIIDDGGFTRLIKYNNVQSINVSVKAEIEVSVDFEGDTAMAEIKDNIMHYINSLGVGTDVVLSALYGYIYAEKGVVKVTSLKLSTNGTTFNTDDVEISALQIAVCNSVDITEVE